MTTDTHTAAPAAGELTGSAIRKEQAGLVRQAAALLVQAGMDSPAQMLLRLAHEKEQPPEAFQERTFFRDTYLVTVVREWPHALESLGDIAHAISEGGVAGQHQLVATEPLDFEQARQACEAVGTDPALFRQLVKDGGGEVVEGRAQRGG
jgi:hypothetical protein